MRYQTIIAYGSIIAGLLGCEESPEGREYRLEYQEKLNAQNKQPYFASVPMPPESGIALTSGDFDGDGDVDFIVSAFKPGSDDPAQGALYLFLNDGKGNFTLKEPKQK